MKHLRLYFLYDKEKGIIRPLDHAPNNLMLPPGYNYDVTWNLSTSIIESEYNVGCFLAKINFETKEIIEIEKYYPPEWFISRAKREELGKENAFVLLLNE